MHNAICNVISVLPEGLVSYIEMLSHSDISGTWQSYEKALLGKATLIEMDKDLVDIIWTDPDRPPRPNNPPFVHTIEFAGIPLIMR
jgi:hypothetical protein